MGWEGRERKGGGGEGKGRKSSSPQCSLAVDATALIRSLAIRRIYGNNLVAHVKKLPFPLVSTYFNLKR